MENALTKEEITVNTSLIVSNPTTRYFLIKSYSHDNIGRSLQHNVWATSQRNEKILHSAYEPSSQYLLCESIIVLYMTSAFVVLIFSVNHSSRFSGFAIMTSLPGQSSCEGRPVFCGPDGTHFPGRMFSIQWVTRCELFFRDCEHLINTFNENKSVKVGRDGQEIDSVAGSQLCWLMEANQLPENRPHLVLNGSSLKSGSGMSSRIAYSCRTTKDYKSLAQKRAPNGLFMKKNLADNFSAVADILKQNIPAQSQSHIEEPHSYSAKDTPAQPPVSFDWVEKEIMSNPILSIFPLNLTQIASYEEYQSLYMESKAFWRNLEETYGAENIPPLPKSVALTSEELQAFDTTILLNLLDYSASQEDINTFLKPFIIGSKENHISQQLPENMTVGRTVPEPMSNVTHRSQDPASDTQPLLNASVPQPERQTFVQSESDATPDRMCPYKKKAKHYEAQKYASNEALQFFKTNPPKQHQETSSYRSCHSESVSFLPHKIKLPSNQQELGFSTYATSSPSSTLHQSYSTTYHAKKSTKNYEIPASQ